MNVPQSSVDVRRDEAGDLRLILHGDIAAGVEASLAEAYASAVAGGDPKRIVLDFADVGYINSSGIAVVVQLLAQTRHDHRELLAVGLSPHYAEIFRITRLSDFITILDDEPGRSPDHEETLR